MMRPGSIFEEFFKLVLGDLWLVGMLPDPVHEIISDGGGAWINIKKSGGWLAPASLPDPPPAPPCFARRGVDAKVE
jgi:hypothetical protein